MSRLARSLPAFAVAALPLLAACDEPRGPRQVRENAFRWEGVIAPGRSVRVRELRGHIEVTPSPDSLVRVSARIEWRRGDPDTDLRLTASETAGDLLVCALWGDGGTCTAETYNANLRVGRGTDAQVHFAIEVPAGVELDLVNIDGDIRSASSAPVLARTVNGDVIVATAVGPVQAKTMNGSVDVRMSSLANADSVKAETMNGDAFVYLPDGVGAAFDLAVTNGSAASDFPVLVQGQPNPKHLRGTLGDGGHVVWVRSINGEVALRRLDAEGRSTHR